jgi:hypothetical protein
VLLQSLLLIATLTVLGGSILASTLVTAKAAFHAKVMRAGESAMNDATADFVAWAQKNVRDAGIDQLPVWSAVPQTIGPSSACVEAAAANQGATTNDPCKLYETIRWNVTGYSGSASSPDAAGSESLAAGLSSAQDEQRVSATITVAITDANQSVQYATRSRELTARVFHSAPYAAVTGERDAASQDGAISSAEGDTAGYAPQYRNAGATKTAPDQSRPSNYSDTTIITTVDCINTADNSSPNALADNNNVIYSRLRAYGNLAWIFETPCKQRQDVDPATAPLGYEPPNDNVYKTTGTTDANWQKHDENSTGFAW